MDKFPSYFKITFTFTLYFNFSSFLKTPPGYLLKNTYLSKVLQEADGTYKNNINVS